ncbi:MAG: SRPBCC family protein [Amaricoccus sp.]
MAAGFTLITDWLLDGSIEEVADVLGDAERFPDWWPEVYLSVREVAPGDADGIGRAFALHTRGWLPYTLDWTARLVEQHRPHGWTVEATGDLVGRGVWTLEQRGTQTAVRYDWRIEVEKPLLKPLTPLLKPVYAANHRWAMARGHEGLQRELARRRA